MESKTQEHWIKKKQEEWLEIALNGERFKAEDNSGYLYKGKKHYNWFRGKRIIGKNYIPHNCVCLPWEDCECGQSS